jgi:hypothetical protein
MSIALRRYKPNFFVIERIHSNGGLEKVDLTNSLISFDYFEDILSPTVTAIAQIATSSSLFNLLPIRGGEKIYVDIDTAFGNFELNDDFALYVYKVSGISPTSTSEVLTLHMVSREALTNETSRCQIKYYGNIKPTVTRILTEDLKTRKFLNSNIEPTANTYNFIGNNRKPFHVLTWLGPKAIPSTSKKTGASGDWETSVAKGVAGFLFYETKEGFNFRSIDTLVSPTNSQFGTSDMADIPRYVYKNVIQQNDPENDFTILNYGIEKNIDLLKSLRVGQYVNKTYFYDLYSNTFDLYTYYLKDEIKGQSKLGTQDSLYLPKAFEESPSRIMAKISDRGALNSDGSIGSNERTGADMAKSYSRYNLLFTQSLSMIVPMNVNLKAGDIINAIFPSVNTNSESKDFDEEQSGFYLIKEVRHHFEPDQMVSSLKLVRDSYGLYGTVT